MKHNSRIVIIITALLALILVGCGKKAPTHATSNQEFLSGVYKETDQDTPKDDEGRAQPNYFYFKRMGTYWSPKPKPVERITAITAMQNGEPGKLWEITNSKSASRQFMIRMLILLP